MVEGKPALLIAEDDPEVAEMLNLYFRDQGYLVTTVNWGEDAVNVCRTKRPDLVILDIRLPDIDGFEVARSLRSDRRTESIPIIFLTEKRSRADLLQGLEIGADDYITKPFDIHELRLRVKNALNRSIPVALTNPVTNLPEGALVDERLNQCLQNNGWALLEVSLIKFEDFRDAYGFVASNDVLRAITLMISNAVLELGSPNDFIGQINPTEFILVTGLENVSALGERIRTRLERTLDYFYPVKDREREDFPARRFEVHVGQLLASQGPFADLDSLKTELVRQRL